MIPFTSAQPASISHTLDESEEHAHTPNALNKICIPTERPLPLTPLNLLDQYYLTKPSRFQKALILQLQILMVQFQDTAPPETLSIQWDLSVQ
jgi:hypothetical protein